MARDASEWMLLEEVGHVVNKQRIRSHVNSTWSQNLCIGQLSISVDLSKQDIIIFTI